MSFAQRLESERRRTRTGARRRLTHKVVGMLLGATLVATIVQAALLVYQNNSTTGLYAERYNVGSGFVVDSTDLSVVDNDRTALGTQGAEIEVSDNLPEARMTLVKDNWMYQAVVKETAIASITGGTYTAELYVDGTLKGAVYLKQATSDPSKVEGATIGWNLGTSISSAPMFIVKLKPFVQTGPTVQFTLDSKPDNTWLGSAPAGIAGTVNPALTASVGDTVKITGRLGATDSGNTHNLRIMNAGGSTPIVTGPTSDIVDSTGQTLTWVPSAAGTYQYECQYHKSTMKGTLTIA